MAGYFIFFSPTYACPIVYFTTWQYRQEFIFCALNLSVLFGAQAIIYITVIYGRIARNLYNFKRTVPEAVPKSRILLFLAYATVTNTAIATTAAVIGFAYPVSYPTTNVIVNDLGDGTFVALQ